MESVLTTPPAINLDAVDPFTVDEDTLRAILASEEWAAWSDGADQAARDAYRELHASCEE